MGEAEVGAHRSGYESGHCPGRYGYTVTIVFLKRQLYH